jgi:hypothetical protein
MSTLITLNFPPGSKSLLSDGGDCATCPFGELSNSRLGDQVVIATIKDGKPLSLADGVAMSVPGEDSTGGRSVKRFQNIEVR